MISLKLLCPSVVNEVTCGQVVMPSVACEVEWIKAVAFCCQKDLKKICCVRMLSSWGDLMQNYNCPCCSWGDLTKGVHETYKIFCVLLLFTEWPVQKLYYNLLVIRWGKVKLYTLFFMRPEDRLLCSLLFTRCLLKSCKSILLFHEVLYSLRFMHII